MPKISQLADVSVAALLSKLGFGSAKQQLLRYVQAGDGTDLSLAYDRAIAAGARTLRIPEGSWTWSTPKDYVSGLKIIGDDEIKTSGVGGTKITANNGFLKNDNTTRKQIVIKNLHIIGNRTASSVGIDGPFGGVISGCKIEGFDALIKNMSGYLVMYKRISFEDGAFGIQTADANGTVIEQCHFNDDVAIQVTTRDGTPQSGVNSGLPLIIRENNFNLTDLTTASLKVRGQLDIRGNYFEKFSGSVLNTMIDLEVNRFDHQGAIIESNEFNGQSANCRGIYINGSHLNLENWTEGRITANRMLGLATYIEYGPNNRIPGLRIYGNSRTTGDFIPPVVNSYKVQHYPPEAWQYVILNSDFTTSSATAVDVTGLAFTPEPSAHYEMNAMLILVADVAGITPQPGFTWPTNMGSGVAFSQYASAISSSVSRHGNTSAAFTSGGTAIDAGEWPMKIEADFLTTSTTTGNLQFTLKSETAANVVRLKAGSYIKYRRIA